MAVPPVAEVAGPGDEHRATDGVDRRDRLGVAHRAAGLGERPDAGREAGLDGVGEREERVAGAGRPDRRVRHRASRAPWRRPGGRRRRVTSGRCRCPTSRRSRTSTIAFEVTPRTSRQARSRSSCSSSVGARRVAQVQVVGGVGQRRPARSRGPPRRRSGSRRSDAARRRRPARRAASASSTRTRRFGLVARTSSAASSKAGATTTSRKIEVRASATAAIDRAGQRDDATERADRVGLQGRLPGVERASAARRRRTGWCA